MKDFTFIVTTYNHENYIIEHLNSIKYIINRYGNNIEIDLIVADDNSNDQTLLLVRKWLEEYRNLFRNVAILKNKNNLGTVKNIINAIEKVKTTYFKESAGDDKYYTNNIFELFEENTMYITPVLPFGTDFADTKIYNTNYKHLLNASTNKKMKKLLSYTCLIPAPGVFLDSAIYREKDLLDFLNRFTLIEDYPTWYYLLNKRKKQISIKVLTKPYVCYRVGSGISTVKVKKEKNYIYLNEVNLVYKTVNQKLDRYPKLINPYLYIFKIKSFFVQKKKDHNSLLIDELYNKIENGEITCK